MRKFLIIAASALMLGSPATAQFGPIDDILEDIIDGPRRHVPMQSAIETIPVNVDMQSLRSMAGHSVIINVYKPVQPGMKRPQLIGQTRMLLTGLPENLGLVVAVPEPVTRDLDFVVVNGVVVDEYDQEVLSSRQDEFYKGRGDVRLDFINPSNMGQPLPGQNTANTPAGKVETLKGKVSLPSNSPELVRGASMTVELVELDASGLAGGAGETIIGQTFVDLDQEKSPFKFKLDYVTPAASNRTRVLRAQITDWAGRRIYETYRSENFRGDDDDYRLAAEPARQP